MRLAHHRARLTARRAAFPARETSPVSSCQPSGKPRLRFRRVGNAVFRDGGGGGDADKIVRSLRRHYGIISARDKNSRTS